MFELGYQSYQTAKFAAAKEARELERKREPEPEFTFPTPYQSSLGSEVDLLGVGGIGGGQGLIFHPQGVVLDGDLDGLLDAFDPLTQSHNQQHLVSPHVTDILSQFPFPNVTSPSVNIGPPAVNMGPPSFNMDLDSDSFSMGPPSFTTGPPSLNIDPLSSDTGSMVFLAALPLFDSFPQLSGPSPAIFNPTPVVSNPSPVASNPTPVVFNPTPPLPHLPAPPSNPQPPASDSTTPQADTEEGSPFAPDMVVVGHQVLSDGQRWVCWGGRTGSSESANHCNQNFDDSSELKRHFESDHSRLRVPRYISAFKNACVFCDASEPMRFFAPPVCRRCWTMGTMGTMGIQSWIGAEEAPDRLGGVFKLAAARSGHRGGSSLPTRGSHRVTPYRLPGRLANDNSSSSGNKMTQDELKAYFANMPNRPKPQPGWLPSDWHPGMQLKYVPQLRVWVHAPEATAAAVKKPGLVACYLNKLNISGIIRPVSSSLNLFSLHGRTGNTTAALAKKAACPAGVFVAVVAVVVLNTVRSPLPLLRSRRPRRTWLTFLVSQWAVTGHLGGLAAVFERVVSLIVTDGGRVCIPALALVCVAAGAAAVWVWRHAVYHRRVGREVRIHSP